MDEEENLIKLDSIDGNKSEKFGRKISISGDGKILAVGSPDNSSEGFLKGRVSTFKLNNGVYEEFSEGIYGINELDHFGFDIDMSDDGKILAISSVDNDNTGNNSGLVEV